MLSARREKLEGVASRRQGNLTVVLENVHDPHNIGAVMRSCDSVGIREMFVLYTEPHLNKDRLPLGNRTAAGAQKWVDVRFFTEVKACFEAVRQSYQTILCTRLGESAKNLYDLDLSGSLALVFGNERDGVSDEALAFSDGNFIIPQMGMAESLNVSVACAVSLYEAFRQRRHKGFYDDNPTLTDLEKKLLQETYLRRHEEQYKPRKALPEK